MTAYFGKTIAYGSPMHSIFDYNITMIISFQGISDRTVLLPTFAKNMYGRRCENSSDIIANPCTVCGRNKSPRHRPYGLLKPLPIPGRPWDSPLAEFAYNNAPNASTGITPFFANKGYHPNITIYPECALASLKARELAVNLDELHSVLKDEIAIAQSRYKEQANCRRIPLPKWNIGDHVLLSSKYIKLARPTRKFSETHWIG